MDRVIYFAYGSNLSTPRLRFRVPGAQPIGLAHLTGHRLMFRKRGSDGSAKCDAAQTDVPEDVVIGVLFAIPAGELEGLHRAEGRGHHYSDHWVRVTDASGDSVEALIYRALPAHFDDQLAPYRWYWDFVADGAREHGIPADYIAQFIDSVRWVEDPDTVRDVEERRKVLHRVT